jgi:hypothetical protein
MDGRKDPMALWVGTWAPEDVIDRETRLLERRDPADRSDKDSAEPSRQ